MKKNCIEINFRISIAHYLSKEILSFLLNLIVGIVGVYVYDLFSHDGSMSDWDSLGNRDIATVPKVKVNEVALHS